MDDKETIVNTLVTVRDYLRWATSLMSREQVFFGHGSDNPWDESVFLLQAALDWPEDLSEKILEAKLLPKERERVVDWLGQRVGQRKPLPYITGRAWFAEMPFICDERAIIPRSPIAELIRQGYEPWYQGCGIQRVLDLCAGGGCIGIASAMWLPDCEVDLVEIDPDTAQLAQDNIAFHGLGERVKLVQSDLFDGLPDGSRYDVIVSNPPYVDAADLASMPEEFHHEPGLALAAGADGLDLARRILAQAADFLSDDGLLVLEVGNSGEALEQAFPSLGFTWVDFEHGGEGVLVAAASELKQWRELFA